jgi:HEAT repeat protein
LGLIGPAAAPALPALSQLLRDRQLPVVSETAAAMSAIGPPAVPYLAAALTDTNHASRGQVLTALGNLGPAAAPAAPAIAGVLLAGEDHNAATLAAQTLSRIGPAALPAMVEALSGAGAAAGERLEATLAQLAGSQPGALDALERELRQAPPAVKPALLRAVQQVTTYPRRRALIIARTLADADPALRAAAAEWLRRHASVAELERPLAGEAESLRHLVEAVFRGDESSPASAGR